ncbi:MAG: ABC transporter permease [Gemmatimonadota bacterium]
MMFALLVRMVIRIAFPSRFRVVFAEELAESAIQRAQTAGRSRRNRTTYRAWILLDLVRAGLRERLDAARAGLVEVRRGGISQSVRGLIRTPAFTVSAVTLLGLSFSGCLTVLAIAKGYLLQAPPLPEADRIVTLDYWTLPGGEGLDPWGAPHNIRTVDWDVARRIGDAVLTQRERPLAVVGTERTEWIRSSQMSSDFFALLGRPPALGRYFGPADAPNVAVISHRLWLAQFGGAEDVIGTSFRAHSAGDLDDPVQLFVIGVLPQDAWFPIKATDVVTPIVGGTAPRMIRLRPGVDRSDAAERIAEAVSTQSEIAVDPRWRPSLTPLGDGYRERATAEVLTLLIAAGTFLSIALTNVSALFLVRAEHRRKEFSTRRALGASEWRLRGQVFGEAATVVAAAAVAGGATAVLAFTPLAEALESRVGEMPGGTSALTLSTVDLLILGVGLLVVTFLLGAVTDRVLHPNPSAQSLLRSRSATARSRDALTAVQIGMSVAVLILGGLLGRAAFDLSRVDMGYTAHGALAAEVGLHSRAYQEEESQRDYFRRLLSTVRSIPEVESAAILRYSLAFDVPSEVVVRAELGGDLRHRAVVQPVGEGFFETLRVPVMAGRSLLSTDDETSQPVAVVSTSFAQDAWGDQSPIGRQVRLGIDDDQWHTVVGVVGDVREHLTRTDLPNVYVSRGRHPHSWGTVLVRSGGSEPRVMALVEEAAARIDSEVPLWDLRPLSERIEAPAQSTRLLASLLFSLALLAIGLTAIGVHGTVSYRVERQATELRIRMALGADVRRVTRRIMVLTTRTVTGGVILGVAVAAIASRSIESQLFGVSSHDPLTYAALGATVIAIGLLSARLAARRVTRIPIAAME